MCVRVLGVTPLDCHPTHIDCNTLQHTETHYSTLQHTATHCKTRSTNWRDVILLPLSCNTHCNTLQHTATHCNALQPTATHCNTLQHTTISCDILQHTITRCTMKREVLGGAGVFKKVESPRSLQHTALQCKLHHAAAHCIMLQHAATRDQKYHSELESEVDSPLPLAATSPLPATLSHHHTMQYRTARCNTWQ